jgi:site-specific DNA recombinase
MRVVGLFRVSTEKQEEQGSSLESQAREYRERAARNGWTTVAEFKGSESASGAASDRQVLQRLLACLRDNDVDAVWVIEQSRLTRGDELEVALLMRELRERRVKIIIRDSTRDPASIDEGFMLGIQSLVDRTESLRIKERMRRGKNTRAGQGRKTCGAPPLGYRNPRRDEPGRGTLAIVEEEAAVVRRLFAFAAKGMGDHAVVRAMNDLGLPASRGGKWGKTSVRRVLENVAYIGTSAANVWIKQGRTRGFKLDLKNPAAIVVENAHEAIIDRETWDAVHGRARQPRTLAPRLLAGLIWCNGQKYGGDGCRNKPFYAAGRGQRGGPWLDMEATDEAVWSAFASLATSPEFVERLMREAAGAKEQEILRLDIEHLEGQADKMRKRLGRLTTMRADGELTKDDFLARSAEAREALGKAQGELAELRARAVVLDGSHAARVVKAVQTLLAGRTRLTGEQRRAVLRSIVRRVDVAAERTGAAQRRGKGGGFGPSGGPAWRIANVSFRLALPHGGAETGVDTTWGGGIRRDRDKVTTGFDCAQAPVTEGPGSIENGGHRTRRLGTTD